MKLNQLTARLPALYYSALAEGGPSYWLGGPAGLGKTSVFRLFPKLMKRVDPKGKYALGGINGANFTLMTAMGYMIPREDERQRTIARFSLPYWYYVLDDHGKRTKQTLDEFDGGILLIDEADKMGMDEKKIVGEAALTKVLGDHSLPDGWVVMFAGNRMSDKTGSTRDLRHLINRRIYLEATPDVEAWADWARAEGLLPEVIDFAENNPQLLFEPLPEDERPWCTPRSLHQVDIHLRSLMASFETDRIPTDPLTVEEIKGGIGTPAATALLVTVKTGYQLHKFEEVIAAPTTIATPKMPDAQRLMSYKMAWNVSEATAKPALQFMARMPEEHQAMFVRMAVQRNYQIAFQPDFAAWCAKKASLIAILTNYKVEDK